MALGRYMALSTTNVYRGATTSSPIIGTSATGTIVIGYRIVANGKWICLNEDGTSYAPLYDASGKPIFQLMNPNDTTKEKAATADDIKTTAPSKTSNYYYIGTDWNEKQAINPKGGQFNSKEDAIKYYDTTLRTLVSSTNNYKVWDSEGNAIYPSNVSPASNLETSQMEDESDIDWVKLYGMSSDMSNDYQESIDSLSMKNIKDIMGLPYQWSPLQDPRITDGSDSDVGTKSGIGRTFGDKILARVPLLLITPGIPEFMGSYDLSTKKDLISQIISSVGGEQSALENIATRDGKYYNLKFDYVSYYNCVNPMCRAGAYFLGIQDTVIDGTPLKAYDYMNTNKVARDKFLNIYKGCVPFYVNSETSIQDSFSNDTTQSSLADKINGYSSMANELNYILGSSKAGALYDDLASELSGSVEEISNLANDMLGGSNLISSIGKGLDSVLAGGKLIFPEIWSDSSFTRSYDVTVKLITPDNDKLSWYLNIWVPLAHLIALVLPRQKEVNGYVSPFIVRAFYKGLFNVDMGIVTNMSVQKGGDGQWTQDGLPTSVEVSFTIKDLYNYMTLTNSDDITDNFMNNITLLDYIGNSCGVNINEIDIARNLEMYLMMAATTAQDKVTNNVFGGVEQWFTNKVSYFGFFN